MIGLIVCSVALAANPPATSAPSSPETYAEARSQAGRSSDDQVRLALWCESRGLTAERLHHLTLAVLADPGNAAARGLMGLVSIEGRWVRPESVAEKVKVDPALDDYEARRLAAPDTAEGQWALATWADDHGLADQARAHFTLVTRLDPKREDAWKRLGFTRRDGRWVAESLVAAEQAEAEARKLGDKKWQPLLQEYRRMLAFPGRRDEVEAKLAGVNDPRAVASIVRVFGATESLQPLAVRLLGQVDAPESTRALASLAVHARSSEARRAAAETLRHRDPREYAEPLIALLAEPIRYEVKHVDGPTSPGELLIEGKRANVRRVYTPPSAFRPGDRFGLNELGESVVYRHVEPGGVIRIKLANLFGDPSTSVRSTFGIPIPSSEREVQNIRRVIAADPAFVNWSSSAPFEIRFGALAEIPMAQMAGEVRKANAATERKLRDDVKLLDDHNVGVRLANNRVADVLNAATGQSLSADRRTWSKWFVEQVGYASSSDDWAGRFSVTQPVSIAYQTPVLPENSTRDVVSYTRVDCFAAGTPVRTIAGPRAIESLQVGDRVLTQSTVDGSLGYHPVVTTHKNPALATTRVKLRGEAIVASQGHRFWVADRGWVMARDLKAGDPVRTLGGVSPVEAVEPGVIQPLFNIDVADDADFFAGEVAALVHDNALPDPRLVPFDRVKPR